MSQRLLEFYSPQGSEDRDKELKWVKQLRKLIKAVGFMEKTSKLQIKVAENLTDLSQQLKVVFDCSDASSSIST